MRIEETTVSRENCLLFHLFRIHLQRRERPKQQLTTKQKPFVDLNSQFLAAEYGLEYLSLYAHYISKGHFRLVEHQTKQVHADAPSNFQVSRSIINVWNSLLMLTMNVQYVLILNLISYRCSTQQSYFCMGLVDSYLKNH